MLKSLSTYKPVMGIVYKGNPVTNKVKAIKLIKLGGPIEIMSWSGGEILFYFDPTTNDVVYANDVTYIYMIDDEPTTALELIKKAKSKGFGGNDTNRAAMYLNGIGHKVKNNPNPTHKFTDLRSH